MSEINTTPGSMLRHKYTGELLWVLRVGKEQILCRTKDLREIWFYAHELQKADLKESRTSRFL